MCPVCIATIAAMVAAGGTSAGGLAAFARKVVSSRSGALRHEAPKGAVSVSAAKQEPAHAGSKAVLRVNRAEVSK